MLWDGRERETTLGRRFRWLWAAYAVSTLGTWLAFDAFPLIAILVLHAGPAAVSALAATGLAVGALVAVPLGPWVEFRRKRPVMVAMDLTRFAALMSIPAAFALGRLSFAQLLVVSVVVGAADIAFKAAGGAFLKALVRPDDLLVANGRFEATAWTATAVGPPLGGAAIGLLGPVVTVAANAASYLLSAAGIRAIGGSEPHPARAGATPGARGRGARGLAVHPGPPQAAPAVLQHRPGQRPDHGDVAAGRRPHARPPRLRALAVRPRVRSALRRRPARGAAVATARRAVRQPRRHAHRGTLRACWSLGLAFVVPGTAGLVLVMAIQFGLVTCMGVFNPVFATYRLRQTAPDRVARTLSAWSITSVAAIAAMTGLWGLLAGLAGLRAAIAIAGLLLLATPLLLPRRDG